MTYYMYRPIFITEGMMLLLGRNCAGNGPVYAGTPYRNFFLFLNFMPTFINIYYIQLCFQFFFWRYILVSLLRSIPAALLSLHLEHWAQIRTKRFTECNIRHKWTKPNYVRFQVLTAGMKPDYLFVGIQLTPSCEISSSHGGEYDVQSCLLGYTAV
jgi:hypothetical protein